MTYRVVQLTDCHLFADQQRSLRGVATRPRFVTALRDVRRQAPETNLLVFTGDTAHDEASATYECVRDALADWGDRVRIIPGNHDDRAFLGELFPRHGDGPAGRVTFHVSWPDWQVLGLDSQQPGELPGSLGTGQLEWLRARLEETKSPTLLFVHHPPITVQSPWLDRIGLQDAPALERLLGNHPQVRLVVCGHVHQQATGSLAQATVLTTQAVGPQFRPRTEQLEIDPGPPAFRILELHSNGRWTTQVLHCAGQNDQG
jgi:Icc protein